MIGTLKMNGTARTGAFTADGTQLLTSGGDGTGGTSQAASRLVLLAGTSAGAALVQTA